MPLIPQIIGIRDPKAPTSNPDLNPMDYSSIANFSDKPTGGPHTTKQCLINSVMAITHDRDMVGRSCTGFRCLVDEGGWFD